MAPRGRPRYPLLAIKEDSVASAAEKLPRLPPDVLGGRPDVEHQHLAALEPPGQLVPVDHIDPVPLTQVGGGQALQAGHMIGGDVPHGRPQLRDPLAGERVEDPGPLAPGGDQASARRWCEVLATLWPISAATSSTERSPWARTSTSSARRPLARALATSAKPS